jgi:hypothetical protein
MDTAHIRLDIPTSSNRFALENHKGYYGIESFPDLITGA